MLRIQPVDTAEKKKNKLSASVVVLGVWSNLDKAHDAHEVIFVIYAFLKALSRRCRRSLRVIHICFRTCRKNASYTCDVSETAHRARRAFR